MDLMFLNSDLLNVHDDCSLIVAGLLQLFHLGMECRLMNVDGCYVLLCCKCTFIGMVVLVMQHVGCLGLFHAIPAGFLLDDGSSSCCCWANAERSATLLRLQEEPTTSYHLGRILKKQSNM
ncbi:hypothetical protein KIW84_063763 [Lathyrus oleraceus]|nr:hypothetical protein KIW84_063763 [Pisum sativum]